MKRKNSYTYLYYIVANTWWSYKNLQHPDINEPPTQSTSYSYHLAGETLTVDDINRFNKMIADTIVLENSKHGYEVVVTTQVIINAIKMHRCSQQQFERMFE